MQDSGVMGLLYTITDWIMRLSFINMFWVITNLPLIAIILLIALEPTNQHNVFLIIPLILLLPILFFPGSVASLAVIRDQILQVEQAEGFWRHYKRNFRQAFTSGTILTCIWIVWIIDYLYLRSLSDLLGVLMIILGMLLLAYTLIYMSLSVHFHMGNLELFKNAFFITLGSPLLVCAILIIQLLIVLLSMRYLFLLPFFSVAISLYVSFYLINRYTVKIKRRAMELENKT